MYMHRGILATGENMLILKARMWIEFTYVHTACILVWLQSCFCQSMD